MYIFIFYIAISIITTLASITSVQLYDFYSKYLDIDFQIESGYDLLKENNSLFYQLVYEKGQNYQTITQDSIFIIWLSGGPGCSSQNALYELNGPFIIDKTDTDYIISSNPYSWNEFASILYLDQPFGAGFSYGDIIIQTTQQATQYFINFMINFLTLHQEFRISKLYLSGFNYAGHFIPFFSEALLNDKININYQGIIIGNPLSNLLTQISGISSYLYLNGLINENEYQNYNLQEAQIQYLILQKKTLEAGEQFDLYQKIVQEQLFIDNENINNKEDNKKNNIWFDFMKQYQDKFKISKYSQDICNLNIYNQMKQDFSLDLSNTIIELLNKGKIFIFNGQMDIEINNGALYQWISTLKSSIINEWKKTQKQSLKILGKTVGNYKQSNELTLAIIYNGGHNIISDQPQIMQIVIKEYLQNNL